MKIPSLLLKKTELAAAALLALSCLAPALAQDASAFRPPAVPLVTFNPLFSIWSEADKLTDDTTRHWTRREHPLVSMIRVDGQTFRLMGKDPITVPALPQVSVQVLPTRSIYHFANEKIKVTMTFLSPMLPDDLNALSRPLSYITWDVVSADGAQHKVVLYDSVSALIAVNEPTEQVTWFRETAGKLTVLKAGTFNQNLLGVSGDDARINWGYAYAVAPTATSWGAISSNKRLTDYFIADGTLPATIDARRPRAANEDQPTMAFVFDLGAVGAQPLSRHMMIAYDEIYSIKFFGKPLRPYWRNKWATPAALFQASEKDYATLTARCVNFDDEMMADMKSVGGDKYAQICALAYRQAIAGCGLAVDANGQPMLFTKENTSNGDIATVDVIFPMDPIFVLFSPTLAKASLVPILNYAESGRWKWPCAPHDLGTYPIARGTDDGGEAMPVEESGNMLILCDAIARAEGNADFSTRYWKLLTTWVEYLVQYGLDPEEQLCTDDFMGHLAHNSNLSVKAIIALAAYADLCKMRGDTAGAEKYAKLAKDDAEHWMKVSNDGDHSRLAFDKPGTWSQKYNMAWNSILKLNVFPASTEQKELDFYKTVMQPYGLPLDSRTKLTKTDWTIWSASMAETQPEFEFFVAPIYNYLTATKSRSPIPDSYITDNVDSDGMHARPVIGGVFIRALTNEAIWKKWAGRDKTKTGNWMPVPKKPIVTEVVPTAATTPAMWRYTEDKPGDDWMKTGFDDVNWKLSLSSFGEPHEHTPWRSSNIWLRREFTMPAGSFKNLKLWVYHDEDVEIYFNGILAGQDSGFVTSYVPMEITPAARALLKPGAKITMAVHCLQTTGGQGIDVGLGDVKEDK